MYKGDSFIKAAENAKNYFENLKIDKKWLHNMVVDFEKMISYAELGKE